MEQQAGRKILDAQRARAAEKKIGTMQTVVPNKRKGYRFIKRAFDVVASLLGLIVLSPVFLIIAIVIFIDDPGPVLFFQERTGLNGRVFRIWKFRSMCKDAASKRFEMESQNELDGPAFKMKNDPRITRAGKFLRRSSLDELPQLVNILKGEMSVVGPRPLPTYEAEKCNDYQKQRLLVKPGLTCYWQCSGRNDIQFDEWIEMDLKYICEAGVYVDIKIICKTFLSVLGGRRLLKHPADTKKNISGNKRRSFYLRIKRMLDITGGIFALVVLAPLLLITAAAIVLENGFPVIFIQNRVGQGEKMFHMYKFRSMCKDAAKLHAQMKEEHGDAEVSFKLKDEEDPRITKIGKLIRKYNIDELPQLFNILKGDMSFVGPRPLPFYEYEEERHTYGGKYQKRYTVPQGLTCTWQVSDRAACSFEERMQMDVDYAQNSGLWMDFCLIVKTFVRTVRGKAVY